MNTTLVGEFDRVQTDDAMLEAIATERQSIERDGIELYVDATDGRRQGVAALAVEYPQPDVSVQLISRHKDALDTIASAANAPTPTVYVTSRPSVTSGFVRAETIAVSFSDAQGGVTTTVRAEAGRYQTPDLDLPMKARADALAAVREAIGPAESNRGVVGEATFIGTDRGPQFTTFDPA